MTTSPLPLMSDGEHMFIPVNLSTGRHHAALHADVHGVEGLVCNDLAKRQMAGLARFVGQPVRSPLPHREQLLHAYQRALDLAVDLRRAIAQADEAAAHPHPTSTL